MATLAKLSCIYKVSNIPQKFNSQEKFEEFQEIEFEEHLMLLLGLIVSMLICFWIEEPIKRLTYQEIDRHFFDWN